MFNKFKKVIVVSLLLAVVMGGYAPSAFAVVNPAPYQEAKISFTFDDGFLSTYTEALPVLSARGIKATIYPNSNSMDLGHQDDGFPALTWTQLATLQNTYGWEVGDHTATHPELPLLTAAQISTELTSSKTALESHGLVVTDFATPFGAYDNTVLIEAMKLFESHRGFADIGYNTFPSTTPANGVSYGRADLQVQAVLSTTTNATVQGWIDAAKTNKTWLILVFHDIQPTLNPNYEYVTKTSDLAIMADYAKASGVKIVTVKEGLKVPGVSVLTNSTFASAMTGWTNDNATQVTLDTANNGAASSATPNTNAVKITGGTAAAHLFSAVVSNVPGANYLLEAFYNTTAFTAGELGFYIDEYDANNNWISGQWIGKVANGAVGYFSALYTATSTLVSTLGVQTYATAGSTGTAYVDNIVLHNLDATASATPTPTVTPTGTPSGTPTPTPVATNMVNNYSFETLAGAFAANWTTNSTNWTIDTNTQGNNGTNAAKVVGGTTATHLFSDLIGITNTTANYTWSQFVKTTDLTGEFGFYIDEYDVNGNWISGQWKGMINAAFNGAKTFVYLPTSTLVNKIRLQYYDVANSTGTTYVDSVSLTDNSAPVVTPTPTTDPSVTPTVTPTGTPTATPTPTVTPTPTPVVGVNVLANPSFETVSGTFPTSWTANSSNWVLNTASLGNDGVNSIALNINGTLTHLFSAITPIDSTLSYVWSSYVKTTNLTGEFGFYIDEYDANDVWISGQWKGMINTAFTGTKQFSYVPTTTNVKKVRIQFYTVTGATGDVLLDSVTLSH